MTGGILLAHRPGYGVLDRALARLLVAAQQYKRRTFFGRFRAPCCCRRQSPCSCRVAPPPDGNPAPHSRTQRSARDRWRSARSRAFQEHRPYPLAASTAPFARLEVASLDAFAASLLLRAAPCHIVTEVLVHVRRGFIHPAADGFKETRAVVVVAAAAGVGCWFRLRRRNELTGRSRQAPSASCAKRTRRNRDQHEHAGKCANSAGNIPARPCRVSVICAIRPSVGHGSKPARRRHQTSPPYGQNMMPRRKPRPA